MLLAVNPDNPQPRLIAKIVEILQEGGVIAYPTDTFYGIGCDIMNKKAIERVYQIKNRDKNEPFSFICSDLKNISEYAKVSNFAYRNMKRVLPGPFTLILPGSKMVPKIMLTKRKTAGIRVPNNNIVLAIAKALGHPILSTSASNNKGNNKENGAKEAIFSDPSLIHDHFGAMLDAVVDGGEVPNIASSVVSLIDDIPEIIRYGAGDVSIFE
ncbi:MAG: threonylcarbamoyl-AMP synthase [Desulfamplus sp.]|nr:threonylcarbamoyl-AMP synthase [Desulfamplus sp.]MBF0241200.1 threonylcarbamoyl-AMP synthase [Desulfamplus sp.]MBF0389930.1 threonylcarbamoyl-AMP synthase [Desulfamplus sp.]